MSRRSSDITRCSAIGLLPQRASLATARSEACGQLAERIGSSQFRVAKIEAASIEVSLDLMLRGFFSAGGRLSDLVLSPQRPSEPKQSRSKRSRAGDRSS